MPKLSLTDFQRMSARTLNYLLDYDHSLSDYGMGLAGESGEVVEVLKKAIYHKHELNKDKLAEELGDVLFYVAALATTIGYDLGAIADGNIIKLLKRYPDWFKEDRSRERTE